MANPLELVDGSARAWMGHAEVVLILIPILVVVVVVVAVVMREVMTMVTIGILIVGTSCPE
jgi:hypothetical protein